MKKESEIEINLDSVQSDLRLWISSREDGTLFDAKETALENNEARFQLVEGCFYDYELSDHEYRLGDVCNRGVVHEHKRIKHIGTISPNIFVGTLEISLFKTGEKNESYPIFLEVQSIKTGYRDDYRDMLELITEKCTDLLLESNSPVSHHFDVDFSKDSQSLYQKFAFINSIINSTEFKDAVHRIVSAPVTKWTDLPEEKDIRSLRKFSNKNTQNLIKGPKRTIIPSGHYLERYGLRSLPGRIMCVQKADSVDTPENRFIKHALEAFLKFCSDINKASTKDSKLYKESLFLVSEIETHLHHSFFKNISKPTTLKLNSPVLQKKEGYREVLRTWLMFELAAKLIWQGGEDVYGAGKKDIANLYEYWLFFVLLDLFQELFSINAEALSDLIKPTKDGLSLDIKQGCFTALKGVYESKTRKLNIQFNYNRSFSGNRSYPDSGSWTSTLRPDYTLSFWPFGISEIEAEKQELIVHVQFDAKYKIANLNDLIENNIVKDLDKEKSDNKKGIYKNADLMKMHSYRDAIRRTGGAYILYPGDKSLNRKGFHEILPGLGAFPVRPSKNDTGISELKSFILEIIEHFLNRASQREKIAYRIFDVYRDEPHEVKEALPEAYGLNRNLIPDDIFVLVGFYKNEAHLNWIKRSSLYNTRANGKRGSLRLRHGEANAKYLLLHSHGETKTSRLFEIIQTGPRVFSRQALIEKGYPSGPSQNQDHYLVYDVKEIMEGALIKQKWNIAELSNYKSGRGSALPFSVSMTELMKAKVK